MDKETITISAYLVDIDYLKRNNPLKEELSEKISNNIKPEISIVDILDKLIDYSSLGIEVNRTAKALKVTKYYNQLASDNRLYFKPLVGRIGEDVTLQRLNNDETYEFNENYAALYYNFVVFHQKDEKLIGVFIRKGGSGCKTVIQEAVNQMLRSEGIRMSLNWFFPTTEDDLEMEMPSKIIAIQKAEVSPSDVADELAGDTKRTVRNVAAKELSLNLSLTDNLIFQDGFKNFMFKRMTKEDLVILLKNNSGLEEVDDIKLVVNVGKRSKIINLDEFERFWGGFDITDKIKSKISEGYTTDDAILEASEEFVSKIII